MSSLLNRLRTWVATAASRPSSRSSVGWIPRASARSSAIASSSSPWVCPQRVNLSHPATTPADNPVDLIASEAASTPAGWPRARGRHHVSASASGGDATNVCDRGRPSRTQSVVTCSRDRSWRQSAVREGSNRAVHPTASRQDEHHHRRGARPCLNPTITSTTAKPTLTASGSQRSPVVVR